jgi:hypothetical protein
VIGRGFSRRPSSTARLGLPEQISWTTVLGLIVVFSLFACSPEEVHRPDRGENPEEGIRVGGGGPFPAAGKP